jgi:hypothetical protein
MLPTMAQVLSTLAHELRTPVAVSQGYVKLFLDGRLKTQEDVDRAMKQTQDAIARLAGLCSETGTLASLAESPGPPIKERVAIADLVADLKNQQELSNVTWQGDVGSRQAIEAGGRHDLTRAVAVVAKTAVDDARGEPVAVNVADGQDGVVRMHVGVSSVMQALSSGPAADGAAPFDVVRGGRGLSVVWAAFILANNRVETWQHASARAGVGFLFPRINP